MRLVLGIASVLRIVGLYCFVSVCSTWATACFSWNCPHLQPMMYLMLSVAGYLTIFRTRMRCLSWFYPSREDFVDGCPWHANHRDIHRGGCILPMPPLVWGWAGFVWAYALGVVFRERLRQIARVSHFLIESKIPRRNSKQKLNCSLMPKVMLNRGAKSDAKSEVKPEAKAVEPKPEAKVGQKPDAT